MAYEDGVSLRDLEEGDLVLIDVVDFPYHGAFLVEFVSDNTYKGWFWPVGKKDKIPLFEGTISKPSDTGACVHTHFAPCRCNHNILGCYETVYHICYCFFPC